MLNKKSGESAVIMVTENGCGKIGFSHQEPNGLLFSLSTEDHISNESGARAHVNFRLIRCFSVNKILQTCHKDLFVKVFH